MNYIILNEFQCEVLSFNKYTSFNGNDMMSNCTCQVKITDASALNTLAQDTITHIQILHDEERIYDLPNLTAHITTVNEMLSGDHMEITLSIDF